MDSLSSRTTRSWGCSFFSQEIKSFILEPRYSADWKFFQNCETPRTVESLRLLYTHRLNCNFYNLDMRSFDFVICSQGKQKRFYFNITFFLGVVLRSKKSRQKSGRYIRCYDFTTNFSLTSLVPCIAATCQSTALISWKPGNCNVTSHGQAKFR